MFNHINDCEELLDIIQKFVEVLAYARKYNLETKFATLTIREATLRYDFVRGD